MAMEVQQRRPDNGPPLRVIEGGQAQPAPERAEVVAEILSDGTVRVLGATGAADDRGFSVGQLTGPGWTLWWDRRRW